MKKRMIVLFAILAIAIIGVFAFFMYLKINGDPTAYIALEENVTEYLIESGYTLADIDSIVVHRDPMKRPAYYAEVVFKDEPDKAYLYCEETTSQYEEVQTEIVQCGEKAVSENGNED